ncbi:hypothetical protein ACWIG5_36700 [Streptomyces lydicus]
MSKPGTAVAAASRVSALENDSRTVHSTTLVVDRAVLWPGEHSAQSHSGVAGFVAGLIDARIEELRAAGRAEPEVALYMRAPELRVHWTPVVSVVMRTFDDRQRAAAGAAEGR